LPYKIDIKKSTPDQTNKGLILEKLVSHSYTIS
jgi:hypothetical protein